MPFEEQFAADGEVDRKTTGRREERELGPRRGSEDTAGARLTTLSLGIRNRAHCVFRRDEVSVELPSRSRDDG